MELLSTATRLVRSASRQATPPLCASGDGDTHCKDESRSTEGVRVPRIEKLMKVTSKVNSASGNLGNNRPTLWIIIPTFHPVVGGTQTQVKELSKALIAEGWSVRVLTFRHSQGNVDGLAAKDTVEGICVTRVYSRGVGKIRGLVFILGALLHLILHGRGGIYHAKDVGAVGWVAVIAKYLLGGRSIVKMRSGRYGYQRRYTSRTQRWQFVTLLHLADRVHIVSGELEGFVSNLGVSAQRVVRIPNSVDTGSFCPPSPEEKEVVRNCLGLPTGKAIVTYVGRLEVVKGVDILIRAWADLPEAVRSEALLMLVGDGSDGKNIVNLINSLDVQDSVAMMGEQQAVRDYYAAADIFVLPSRSEGMSSALFEAMACGLPVIASNVGGVPEVVEDGKNGLMFESENHDQLAEKLVSLLGMRHFWREMGARARQTVMTYADLEKTVYRMQDMYSQLARR